MLVKTLFLLALTAGIGCAATPPPVDSADSPEASIRGAKEVGAEELPTASLYLKFSEEGTVRANELRASGDIEQSDLAAMQAKADAELALALTRQADAIAQANVAAAELQALKTAR